MNNNTQSVKRSTFSLERCECRLAAAFVEIDALQADVDRLTKENTEVRMENICAFGYAYGAGRVSKTDDVRGARELYESGLNGAGR